MTANGLETSPTNGGKSHGSPDCRCFGQNQFSYIYTYIYLFMYLFIYLINYSKVLEADGRRRAGRLARQRVRTAKKTPSIGAILNTGLEALK